MKTKIVLVLISLFLFLSCLQTEQNLEQVDSDPTKNKSTVFSQQIEALRYDDYALSTEAEAKVLGWEKYQELAIQINYLKQGDLSFFTGERDLLSDFLKEFQNGIPENLKTNPIESRCTVVVTAVFKLNDDLTLDNISDELKLGSVNKLLVGFSNLNFQINKKLERDLFDRIQPE